jgi:hypothetical protein
MAVDGWIFYLLGPYPCVELPFIGFNPAFGSLAF